MSQKYKAPWPTKDAMQQIYEKHLWGGKTFDFYSGEGSHQPEIIEPYIADVSNFLKSKYGELSVCDLGCGDFNIGKHLVNFTKKYIAIDIVEPLIKRNTRLFEANNLEFLCLDISKDALPKSDCVILRQVLQHLSNNDILELIPKLRNYKYMILTEHLPEGSFTPNKDIISGQGIRLKHNSGVDVLAAPFNLEVKQVNVFNTVTLSQNKGRIVTTLLEFN